MPGVGKTHWGRIWSRAFRFRLYDLDKLIEQRAGAPIPAIMATVGEAGFRQQESDILQQTIDASRSEQAIISCGGGTPTIPQNLELMLRSGCVAYLKADNETVLSQLRRSPQRRPLLQDLEVERLDELYERRKYFYEQAHVTISLNNAHTNTFAEIQQACIDRHSYRV
jgi:shikimate kinase